jgi:hypothetical protein
MKTMLIVVLCFTLVLSTSAQQSPSQPSALSRNAAKIERRVALLAKGAPIRVSRRGADEEYGAFISTQGDEFTILDVDTKIEVHLKFEDVRKIKDGYGSAKGPGHRAVAFPFRTLIGAVVVAGVIIAIVAVADK